VVAIFLGVVEQCTSTTREESRDDVPGVAVKIMLAVTACLETGIA
jgi:hypothetical protein